MIKLNLTIFLIFYLATAFCRYGIGTTHDERMQTSFKFLKINRLLQFFLFLSFSKKPIAVHCIVSQISNFIFMFISLSFKCSIPTCFKVYFILFGGLVFIPLTVETMWFYICFNGEWKDVNACACAKFRDAEYAFWHNGKYVIGYLDRYINNNCIFFDEEDKICFSGKYKFNLKEKVCCIFKENGEIICLKPVILKKSSINDNCFNITNTPSENSVYNDLTSTEDVAVIVNDDYPNFEFTVKNNTEQTINCSFFKIEKQMNGIWYSVDEKDVSYNQNFWDNYKLQFPFTIQPNNNTENKFPTELDALFDIYTGNNIKSGIYRVVIPYTSGKNEGIAISQPFTLGYVPINE